MSPDILTETPLHAGAEPFLPSVLSIRSGCAGRIYRLHALKVQAVSAVLQSAPLRSRRRHESGHPGSVGPDAYLMPAVYHGITLIPAERSLRYIRKGHTHHGLPRRTAKPAALEIQPIASIPLDQTGIVHPVTVEKIRIIPCRKQRTVT